MTANHDDPESPPRVPPTNGRAGADEAGRGALPVEGDGYLVHLDKFEGPLDLLLHLIKRDEIDIYDIPISHITDQYLASLEQMEKLDLDLDRAGEFLLMAATLMQIKARMLVPRDDGEEEEEGIDPREELVRRLLEYREFRRIAEELGGREEEWRGIFRRVGCPLPEREAEDAPDLGVSVVDLFRAFRTVLEGLEAETPLEMETEEYSVDERMDFIRGQCAASEEGIPFLQLFRGTSSRALLITTFLALLELMRLREVLTAQVDRFGEIWIRANEEATQPNES